MGNLIHRHMTANFGSSWRSRFRDGDDFALQIRVWARQCEPFGPVIVDKALQRVTGLGSAFPPTLPEFMAVCREEEGRGKTWQRLPKPEQTKSIGQAALDAMRKAVAVAPKPKPVRVYDPAGPRMVCEQCGGDMLTESAMPKVVAGKLLAVCLECKGGEQ